MLHFLFKFYSHESKGTKFTKPVRTFIKWQQAESRQKKRSRFILYIVKCHRLLFNSWVIAGCTPHPTSPMGPLMFPSSPLLVWCGFKWWDQGVLSCGPSAGWFLIQLGQRGSGVSRLGSAVCAKRVFFLLAPGSRRLMGPNIWMLGEGSGPVQGSRERAGQWQ